MDEDLKIREKVFEDLQHQVLDALNRSNELEALKLKLLEKLVSRLPQTLWNIMLSFLFVLLDYLIFVYKMLLKMTFIFI